MAISEIPRPGGKVAVVVDFYDQSGRRVRETVGFYRTGREKQKERVLDLAATRESERRTQVRAGTYVNPREAKRKAKAAQGPTFEKFTEAFLAAYATHRRSTFYNDRTKVLNKTFGTRRLREISKADLDAYAATRAREVKASTVRRDLAVLRVIFKMAVRWGVIDASPAADLEGPPEPPHRTRFLSREEWTRLDKHAAPYLRPILRCAVLTGLRLREITELRWEDYDRKAGTVTLSGQNKTGSVRTVPVSAETRELLDEQVRHVRCPFVFAFVDDEGIVRGYVDPKSRARISQNTRAAMKAAKIDGASFHTLRHTAGTWLVQRKVPIYEVQRILGHSTPLMTQRYANMLPEDLRGAVDALGSAFAGREIGSDSNADGHSKVTSQESTETVSAPRAESL